jgi:hypothetical protein
MKAKSNIVKFKHSYKKRENIKPYAKYDLDWCKIPRANDNSKNLPYITVALCSRLEYELHRNNYRPVFLTSDWFAQVTGKKRHQNANLRDQISHIYHFKWHPKVRVDGVLLSNVFEVWYTIDAPKILNLQEVETPKKQLNHEVVDTPKNSPRVEKKFSEGGEKILQPIVDKEIINLPKEGLFISNNEKLKIKKIEPVKNSVENSQQNTPQEKSLLESDFLASSELVENDIEFNCTDTALSEIPEYAIADFGLAKGVFDYGHCPPQTVEPVEKPPIARDTNIHKKKVRKMNAPQVNFTPQQQLSCQILKTFAAPIAAELQQKLDIKAIAPNKIGLQFKQELKLNSDEKDRLKQVIRFVYGDDVQMVLVKPDKPKMATKEDTAKRSELKALTPAETKWEAVKNDVLDVIHQNQREYYQSYFARAEVISLDGRKLKLQAKADVCYKMEDKESTIEQMAAKHNVDIEVKNISDRDTLYLPWTFDSLSLPPLTLGE